MPTKALTKPGGVVTERQKNGGGAKRNPSVEEALTAITTSNPKLTLKQQRTSEKFGKVFKKLKKSVGASKKDDFRSDLTAKAMYRAMLAMLLEMIPVAQEKYMETRAEGSAYALNALLTQSLTLNDQIRNMESLEEQAEYIVRQIVSPVLVQFNQNMLMLSTGLKADIDSIVKDPKQRERLHKSANRLLMGQAAYMQEHQKALSDRITSYLLGE